MDTLPAWLTPLLDAETMRAVDRWAIEERGVPGLDLMERAGAAVAGAVELMAGDGPVAVVCGKGNNGGDGLVVARLLRDAGREVTVLCAARPDDFSGDARENLDRLPGDEPIELAVSERSPSDGAPLALTGAAVIVDALLGTGYRGQRSETGKPNAIADAIDLVNGARAPVVSVDVPSGIDASTGVVAGRAVRATVTITFHAAKPGLWIAPGKAHAGEVRTVDIGIPRGAPQRARIGLIAPSVLELLRRRDAASTKFTSGHVLAVGGSPGLTGALRLSAHASMRAGAGYVTACLPAALQATVASAGPAELMTRGLPDEAGYLTTAGVAAVLENSERAGALALGPGLGASQGARAFARELARAAEVALVLDADGLNAHAGLLGDLAGRQAQTVLTPHAGELGRLLELSSAEIERERLRHVRAAAKQAQAVVVLKGDDTLIADPLGRVAVSPGGSPALATAGTGDVLAGIIAALLAQGMDAWDAAAAGVWLHVAAGREAARRQGAAEAVIASDVIAALGAVRGGEARAGGRSRAEELGVAGAQGADGGGT